MVRYLNCWRSCMHLLSRLIALTLVAMSASSSRLLRNIPRRASYSTCANVSISVVSSSSSAHAYLGFSQGGLKLVDVCGDVVNLVDKRGVDWVTHKLNAGARRAGFQARVGDLRAWVTMTLLVGRHVSAAVP